MTTVEPVVVYCSTSAPCRVAVFGLLEPETTVTCGAVPLNMKAVSSVSPALPYRTKTSRPSIVALHEESVANTRRASTLKLEPSRDFSGGKKYLRRTSSVVDDGDLRVLASQNQIAAEKRESEIALGAWHVELVYHRTIARQVGRSVVQTFSHPSSDERISTDTTV